MGNGVGAALMGACGQYVSERGVFYLTAALTLPALVTLLPLRRFSQGARRRASGRRPHSPRRGCSKVLADRRLLIFCGCAMLFTFANAPLLMLISGTLTAQRQQSEPADRRLHRAAPDHRGARLAGGRPVRRSVMAAGWC